MASVTGHSSVRGTTLVGSALAARYEGAYDARARRTGVGKYVYPNAFFTYEVRVFSRAMRSTVRRGAERARGSPGGMVGCEGPALRLVESDGRGRRKSARLSAHSDWLRRLGCSVLISGFEPWADDTADL